MEKYYIDSPSDLEKLFKDYVIFAHAESRRYFDTYEYYKEDGVRSTEWDDFINPDSRDKDRHPKKYPCVLIYAICESGGSAEDKWIYLYEEDFTTILEGYTNNDSKHSGS